MCIIYQSQYTAVVSEVCRSIRADVGSAPVWMTSPEAMQGWVDTLCKLTEDIKIIKTEKSSRKKISLQTRKIIITHLTTSTNY